MNQFHPEFKEMEQMFDNHNFVFTFQYWINTFCLQLFVMKVKKYSNISFKKQKQLRVISNLH